ncbi:MAG: type IV pili methyl-accepting chemotaxis transducer N-terminal domain-containing protein [Bacteroidota bacterium]
MKIGKRTIFKKGFRAYYLLVVSIIVLTIAIQTIVQYSLDKQRNTALVVNLSGRQRMLSQRLLNEVYSCRYHNCDYAELKLTLTKLLQMNQVLQKGSENLDIDPLSNPEISKNFRRLLPSIIWFQSNLSDLRTLDKVAFNDLRFRVDRFVEIMDDIVFQFQKQSEDDIKAMRLIELELAIFSVLIVLFEIFFIVNPIINRIMRQKKKLAEVAWHQSHVFSSHMKNIKDLQYVMKVEKNPERRDEIVQFIYEELDQLGQVSQTIQKSLKKSEDMTLPHHKVLKKVEDMLEKYHIVPSEEITDDDMVRSSK